MSVLWAIGVFVLTIVFFTVLTWLAARLVGKAAGASAAQRFHDAEYIIEHGSLPETWQKQVASLDDEDRRRALAAKREELLRFFRTAPVFEDEKVRRELLERLTRATPFQTAARS